MTVSTVAFSTVQSNTHLISGIATIDNGGNETAQIPCGGRAIVRINAPVIDSSKISFNVVPYPGATAQLAHDLTDTKYEINTTTGSASFVVAYLSGCYSFSIVTSNNQTAARQFQVQCVGATPSSVAV
jgi:hypothetical protein